MNEEVRIGDLDKRRLEPEELENQDLGAEEVVIDLEALRNGTCLVLVARGSALKICKIGQRIIISQGPIKPKEAQLESN